MAAASHQEHLKHLNISPKRLEKIRQLEILDDDILLCSYPKSGCHWVKYIVCLLLNDGDPSAFKDQTEYFPFLDRVFPIKTGISDGLEIFSGHPHPRQALTHLVPTLMPEMSVSGKGKLIYIIRNPKDVCVSAHKYMCQLMSKVASTWKEMAPSNEQQSKSRIKGISRVETASKPYEQELGGYIDTFLSGESVLGSWFDHVREFQTLLSTRPNSLLLVYEHMKIEPVETVRNISQFLGLDHSEQFLTEIADKSSFSNMKKDIFEDKDAKSPIAGVGKEMYFRSGRAGGWVDHMTPEMATKIDEALKSRLGDCDLPINYIGQ